MRGKYLVGADGKTGFTRKKYLEPRGVLLQQSSRYLEPSNRLDLSPDLYSQHCI